ncbi:choice-of-anchor P family protein [Actinokineospora inagensis]|uniref:choice-of-anchor P family protein n=1 Tax=Actinokineospora inagensis TaxID=103730 RepID=UPI000418C606|nr:choice-of-anchor P family protein [Actinokineospora inagensis]
MLKRWPRRACLVGAVVTTAVLAGALPASAAPGDGSAVVVTADIALLGRSTANVGPLAPSSTSGPTTARLSRVDVPGVASTGLVTSAANRDDDTGVVHSEASLADVRVLLSGLGTVGAITARCDATQAGVTGSTELARVNLSLAAVPLRPAPNTTIGLPGIASIVLNEHIDNANGSLTVNAVHLRLDAVVGHGDVVLGSATCGPAAPPMPLASGAGLWAGVGLLAVVALPVGVTAIRRRRVDAA